MSVRRLSPQNGGRLLHEALHGTATEEEILAGLLHARRVVARGWTQGPNAVHEDGHALNAVELDRLTKFRGGGSR